MTCHNCLHWMIYTDPEVPDTGFCKSPALRFNFYEPNSYVRDKVRRECAIDELVCSALCQYTARFMTGASFGCVHWKER